MFGIGRFETAILIHWGGALQQSASLGLKSLDIAVSHTHSLALAKRFGEETPPLSIEIRAGRADRRGGEPHAAGARMEPHSLRRPAPRAGRQVARALAARGGVPGAPARRVRGPLARPRRSHRAARPGLFAVSPRRQPAR